MNKPVIKDGGKKKEIVFTFLGDLSIIYKGFNPT